MANHNNKPSTSSTNVNKNIGSHSNINANKTNSSSDGVWKTQQKSKRIHSDFSVSDNPTSPKSQQQQFVFILRTDNTFLIASSAFISFDSKQSTQSTYAGNYGNYLIP